MELKTFLVNNYDNSKSKLVFGLEDAFHQETDQPDDDLNTSYELIQNEISIEECEEKKPIFSVSLVYENGDFAYNTLLEDYDLLDY